jgi:nucleotide-binding universal stress UspA family protein
MIERVLVPMDSSEMAGEALEFALEAHPDAEITVYHVVGAPTMMMGEAAGLALADDLEAEAEKRADVVFEAARDIAAEYDAEIETDVGLGHPVRAIVEYAEDYDTIVMGSHGQHSEGITRGYLVGNVAKEVFSRSPVPVTFVR